MGVVHLGFLLTGEFCYAKFYLGASEYDDISSNGQRKISFTQLLALIPPLALWIVVLLQGAVGDILASGKSGAWLGVGVGFLLDWAIAFFWVLKNLLKAALLARDQ
mmetsp:Transcript_5418/g.13647  ORF Transcript_5418/g.13647 Transcript_5418/m.13647 type:complete len:106 (-) Transcript_5418:102-419(-)|eukprot:g18166.t1